MASSTASFWEDLLLYNGPVSSYTLVLRDPGTGGARKHVVLGVSATKVAGRTQATPPETGPVLSLTVDHENSVAVMRLRKLYRSRHRRILQEKFPWTRNKQGPQSHY